MSARLALRLTCFLVVALLAAACAGNTEKPGVLPSGKIAFATWPPTNPISGLANVYVMSVDGTDRVRVASSAADAQGFTFAWSPSGARILFVTPPRGGASEIYTVHADGRFLTNLTNHPSYYSDPAWSPDGSRIAFISGVGDVSGDIYVMDAGGGGLRQLTSTAALERRPGWSPDGSRLAFFSEPAKVQGFKAEADTIGLMVANADGSGRRKLVGDPPDELDFVSFVWSPDGKRIAITARPTFSGNVADEIFVANADGSDLMNLTNHSAVDFAPVWSPDGSRLAFASVRDGNAEIYVAAADGSGLKNLTRHGSQDFSPTWSPDGEWIAFVSRRDGNRELYIMRADGSAQTRLTTTPEDEFAPAWAPMPLGDP